ncbi:hercynylcysteine sulfoxide lyase-1 [Elsinoe australis]|uniref:Hercynylcysteine sulfoxide lyase-1 n=1 Tax=Elsinoe australis TaxID=40998 RepID=A0A4U7B4M5_9PEZI|nr:hercynylcysteine sulfoxide lyase-1 [Elsinoe australis]
MVIRLARSSEMTVECGEEARKHFPFDDQYLNLNHGSFGAIPSSVRDLQREHQDASEARPDIYIRYTYPPLLSRSRSLLATYLSAPKSSLVIVPNATTALNTILRNLTFAPSDVGLYFSTIYSAIEKTLLYLAESTPLRLHRISLTYPLSDAKILDLTTDAMTRLRSVGLNPRFLLFDTVSSVPGVCVPYAALTRLCREQNVLSIVDGAHSAGQIPLNLTALDPDFFVSNLHKWLYVPRPCCVLYVPERNQGSMRSSLPTSHGFVPKGAKGLNNPLPKVEGEELSEFVGNFEFIGTRDSSAYVCVERALEWRSKVSWGQRKGEEALMGYLVNQAREAGRVVSEILGTEVLENENRTLGECAFSNVRLPLKYAELVGGGEVDFGKVLGVARWMEKILVDEFNTFVAIFWHGDSLWVRLSAQIYLTLDDWEKAGRWLKETCERARGRKW